MPLTQSSTEWRVLQGDALERLRDLGSGSVQTCVTSPPYWGLRDYGTAEWGGGDSACGHRVGGQVQDTKAKGAIVAGVRPGVDASTCLDCGAQRIDSQLGLEPTPDEYVANLVAVFREVRRVLRDDGTVWLNLGDSYMARQFGWGNSNDRSWAAYHREAGDEREKVERVGHPMEASGAAAAASGLKPKDLVGIPWRVAFALQADGWWLRSDIVWHKPNPMPESVTDRPTRSHEYIFLLTKSARYFYDADAIREQHLTADRNGDRRSYEGGSASSMREGEHQAMTGSFAGLPLNEAGRNKRSVWTVATQPYSEAHFATFPPKLIEPCVLAGCPEGGTVLDPFAGSGTTGVVALRHNRSFVGIELSPEYVEMARRRICDDAPLFNTGIEVAA